ncbi:MAG: hypothetical protein VB853_02925, partial [Pirellulales bacterium]
GWLLSAVVLVASALSWGWQALPRLANLAEAFVHCFGVGFVAFWLSLWSVLCGVLVQKTLVAWRSARTIRRNTMKQLGSYGSAAFITAFASPFLLGELVVLAVLIRLTSFWMLPLLVGLLAINWIFLNLLKQPTVEGKRVMDEIEGFRMYLGAVEKEYLGRLHPPEQTPELFEKNLPYALALGVEQAWAEKFSDVPSRAATETAGAEGYQPTWYHGTAWRSVTAGDFASGLSSSLGGAIASSSTAPGSSSGSSGFSGGGSSGGGGGGGGGGGW